MSAAAQSPEDPVRPVVAIFRSPIFNPSETFVQRHALGLVRYQPIVVGLEHKGHVAPELAGHVVIAGSGERLALGLLGRGGALADRLRPLAPRLVHAHFATDGVPALALADSLGVPLVTTLHGYDVSRSRSRMMSSGRISWMRYALFQRHLMRRGRLFLAVSEALRTKALERGFPARRTLVHYLGVDLACFAAAPEPEPGLILHVGRLVEKKGTAVLLEALAVVGEARLAIVGDGPLRSSLERKAAALGLRDRVCFLGPLPPAEVAQLMRRAWLLAAPSVTARDGDAEGLPTVLKEAAASALPAIGTHHAGIPEAIYDGETGFVVPERNPAALAARIATLLGSRELRGRMGEAARRLAAERFDAARQTVRLEERYDALLDSTLSSAIET